MDIDKLVFEDQKLLIEEIKTNGILIHSIWDLVNTRERYPEIIEILISHLEKPHHESVMEGIVRALAVKDAKGKASNKLIKLYNSLPKTDSSLHWAIGNTVSLVITQNDLDDVITILKDKQNGDSRQMFILGITKLKSDKIEPLLIELLEDENLLLHTISGLRKLKLSKAKDKIALLTNHKNSAVRKKATQALNKLG
jgi:HEAT repeat protein